MMVVPMAMAAISSAPPSDQPADRAAAEERMAILKDVVPVEAIERDRYREVNFRKRSFHNPRVPTSIPRQMELTLASLVNEALGGGEGFRRQRQGARELEAAEPSLSAARGQAAAGDVVTAWMFGIDVPAFSRRGQAGDRPRTALAWLRRSQESPV